MVHECKQRIKPISISSFQLRKRIQRNSCECQKANYLPTINRIAFGEFRKDIFGLSQIQL